MTLFQKTFKQKNNTIPIWFMRQAGRYLPEYMEVRKNFIDFLELCYNSKKAAEVTIQPIKRFGFDAAIIFSDIRSFPLCHSLSKAMQMVREVNESRIMRITFLQSHNQLLHRMNNKTG